MAPPFPAIANRKDQTPQRLAGAIIIPHPEMPTIQLTMSEIRDIVAYIMSLRTEP
jgi:mono/diheme cytochrome c family protein